jgi:hypothetical protein
MIRLNLTISPIVILAVAGCNQPNESQSKNNKSSVYPKGDYVNGLTVWDESHNLPIIDIDSVSWNDVVKTMGSIDWSKFHIV